jgi:hypothetical protein
MRPGSGFASVGVFFQRSLKRAVLNYMAPVHDPSQASLKFGLDDCAISLLTLGLSAW